MESIYLDHAATTPLHPEVIEAMTKTMATLFGNPSSIHRFGRQAHRKLEDMRQLIATSLKVGPHEIIFNSGGTEGDNTAIIETVQMNKHKGLHVITSTIEHPAVLETMNFIESLGFEVTYLPVDEKGQVAITDVKQALREDTILVSIMYGNNEIGTYMPIKEIASILKTHQAIFHTDAVQAYGSEEIFPKEIGVDLLSVSAHKFNGPKGVGFLYKNATVSLPALLHGGEQEAKRRAGTENLIGIIGMGTAVMQLTGNEKERRKNQYKTYQQRILKQLNEANISYKINGDEKNKLDHILNLWLVGIPNDLLLMHLDLQNIAISTGSACTAGTVAPSHVLCAMYGEQHPALKESIRISFGLTTTIEQIDKFSTVLIETIQMLKMKRKGK